MFRPQQDKAAEQPHGSNVSAEQRIRARLEEVAAALGQRIDETHRRLDDLLGRLEELIERMDATQTRMDQTHARLDDTHARLDELERRAVLRYRGFGRR